MTLLERTTNIHQRIEALIETMGGHEEEKELGEFLKEKLSPVRRRLTGIRQTCSAFKACTVSWEQPLTLHALAREVRNLHTAFAQNPKRSTLVAPTSWPALQPHVETALKSTDQAQLNAWSGFCGANAPAQIPDALERDPDVLRYSANSSLVMQYKQLYFDLARRSSAVPRSSSEIEKFLKSAGQAQELLGRIDRRPQSPHEMPPAVQTFFDQISKGPIGLDQVSVEVLDWLRTQGRLVEFRVDVKKA
jgi:hypothetical protein